VTPGADYLRWPLYWFSRLEDAVERGDHAAAAEAQRVLKRLGVRVRYGLPPGRQGPHTSPADATPPKVTP
jgi:hypothetical protein